MVKDREAWCATVHRVVKRRAWLSDWTTTYHHHLQTPTSADMQVLYSSLISADEELIDSKGGRYTRDRSGWPIYHKPCIKIIFTIVWAAFKKKKKKVSDKEPACQCRRCKRRWFDSGLGRTPGGGNGNLLQYSHLENLHGQRSLAGYSP